MSDHPGLPGTMGQQFIEGTPVYDSDGDQVGHVSKHGSESGHLVLHKGRFFPKDVYIPLSAVQSADAKAVYLNMTRDELKLDRYATPHASEQPASTTNVDRSRPVHTQGRSVIEDQPDTYMHGTDSIDEYPDTYMHGTDTIERGAEDI